MTCAVTAQFLYQEIPYLSLPNVTGNVLFKVSIISVVTSTTVVTHNVLVTSEVREGVLSEKIEVLKM